LTYKEQPAVVAMALAVLVVLAIVHFFGPAEKDKRNNRTADGEKVLDDLFEGKTVEQIEEMVEHEYGIKMQLEQREPDEEREEWLKLSLQGLSKAYGNNEPEYTEADVKEPNAAYKAWKEK
jgi:hypothetical protein